MSDCEGCEEASSNCIKNKPNCGKDMVFCEKCGEGFNWDKLPDENVIMESNGPLEFWGAPCHEMVVAGWVCPDCGARND